MYFPAFLLLLGATVSSCNPAPPSTTTTTTTAIPERPIQRASCRYYCIYKEAAYCCDDGSLTLPKDHEPHTSMDCPPEEEQICKDTGIFLNGTAPARVLAKGKTKEQVLCASDGYCQGKQKCCPSPCYKRHICIAGLQREAVQEEWLPELEEVLPEELEELEELEEEEAYLPEENIRYYQY